VSGLAPGQVEDLWDMGALAACLSVNAEPEVTLHLDHAHSAGRRDPGPAGQKTIRRLPRTG
jgi:hypothetical protein